jgi:putative peptide maturation dehydrogenase
VKLAPAQPDVAVSALTGLEVPLAEGELELLLATPTDRWVREADVGDPRTVRKLAAKGLLLSDEPGEPFAELRRRYERLGSPPWNLYAALHRGLTAWRDVEVTVSAEAKPEELADEFARGSPAFIERFGPPPPAFHRAGNAPGAPLPPGDRSGALYDRLLARRTTRGFDRAAALGKAELATVLRYVWGCHGVARLGDEVTILKKTSPSGGSLHPIEVYPLVRSVEGIEPGLYHYDVERHALEPLELLTEEGAEALARSFLGGQWYFSSAQVVFVLTARFERNFWKYRDHDKAYAAVLMDAGHLSQTLYLVCAELGLGAFVAGAINDATIDERLRLPAFAEGAIAICGCGRPAPSGLEPRFELQGQA